MKEEKGIKTEIGENTRQAGLKEHRLLRALGDLDERYVDEAREPAFEKTQAEEAVRAEDEGKKAGHHSGISGTRAAGSRRAAKWAIPAAVLVLTAGLSFAWLAGRRGGDEEQFNLTEASYGVTVTVAGEVPGIISSNELAWLTEEEIFAKYDTAIFRGTVMELTNIEIDFDGWKVYRALAKIKVGKVFRGDCEEDSTVRVVLPAPVRDDIWVEDTEVVSAMRVGMEGIFMPLVCDETSLYKMRGAQLAWKDIADYGFPDGERFAFLETNDGLVFAKWAFESIREAQTLDEIEQYVLKMLDKNS